MAAPVRGLPDASAASFGLYDVTLDLIDVSAGNSADELASAIVNVYLWKRIDGELSRDGGFPIHDVDGSLAAICSKRGESHLQAGHHSA